MATTPQIPTRGSHRPCRSTKTVRMFDGLNKTKRAWDGLRKDDELWMEDADCLVHLYAPGSSRRGASFKVPLQRLHDTESQYLLKKCLYKPSSSIEEEDHSDSGYAASDSSHNSIERNGQCHEMYVPAPMELSRQETFLHHINTRNYFAYIMNKPIVGESFGTALIHLWSRVESWQSKSATRNAFRKYLQEQGYLNFSENIDYAAAALFWSEQARVKDVWIDAFAHCVGMYDQSDRDDKLKMLSTSTRHLLHKASLKMQSNVARATKSLGTFLEEELGPENLGLSKASRDHLDRFRSVLHSFYVHEFGYFPPASKQTWEKRMWIRIYSDFHCLYKYLADVKSANGMTNNHGLNGGICVTQNIKAFDERHGFSSRRHPLPLLPVTTTRRRTIDARMGLGSLKPGVLGSADADLLMQASNTSSRRVTSNALVQAYIHFELQRPAERVTAAEARKVRWLLVYGVLQMLISVIKAPVEVRDSKTPSYPLCVSTEDFPSWEEDTQDLAQVDQVAARLSAELDAVKTTIASDARTLIQPDCEAQSAEDYFSSENSSRRNSLMSVSMTPQPLHPNLPSRTSSIRSNVTSLRRSVVGSLTRRNSVTASSGKNYSTPAAPSRIARPSQYREILIEGYGNGASVKPTSVKPTSVNSTPVNPTPVNSTSANSTSINSTSVNSTSANSTSRPGGNVSGLHLNTLVENIPSEPTQRQLSSAFSQVSSSGWSRRSAGSTAPSVSNSISEGAESPMTELSEEDALEPKTLIIAPPNPSSNASPAEEFEGFDFGLGKGRKSVVVPPPRTSSRFFGIMPSPRTSSRHVVVKQRNASESSVASSVYPERSVQAGDIAETDVGGGLGRGRYGRV